MRELPVFTKDESYPGDIWTATIGDLLLIAGGEHGEVVSVYRVYGSGSTTHSAPAPPAPAKPCWRHASTALA